MRENLEFKGTLDTSTHINDIKLFILIWSLISS